MQRGNFFFTQNLHGISAHKSWYDYFTLLILGEAFSKKKEKILLRLTYLIIIENNRNFKYTGTDTDTDERNTQLKCEFEQNAAEMIICAD